MNECLTLVPQTDVISSNVRVSLTASQAGVHPYWEILIDLDTNTVLDSLTLLTQFIIVVLRVDIHSADLKMIYKNFFWLVLQNVHACY